MRTMGDPVDHRQAVDEIALRAKSVISMTERLLLETLTYIVASMLESCLVTCGVLGFLRQPPDDPGHALAHVIGGAVRIPVQRRTRRVIVERSSWLLDVSF